MLLFIALGVLLSFVIFYFKGRSYPHSVYLGLFFMLLSIYCFNDYVVVYAKSVKLLTLFFQKTLFLSYLIGPMLYLYVRSTITGSARLKWFDGFHFLLATTYFMVSLPYIFSSVEQKGAYAALIAADLVALPNIQPTFLHQCCPAQWIYISIPAQVLLYTLGAAFLLLRSVVFAPQSSNSNSMQHWLIHWIMMLLSCSTILSVTHILAILKAFAHQSAEFFYFPNGWCISSFVSIFLLLLVPFFMPSLLYGSLSIGKSAAEATGYKPKATTSNAAQHAVFHKSETESLPEISNLIEAYIRDKKPYLDSDWNINDFARMIGVSTYSLTSYFHEVHHKSFSNYRRECRVEHVARLLEAGESKSMTIDAIGLASGFSSRSAFFTAFKKVKRTTPGAYLASLKN